MTDRQLAERLGVTELRPVTGMLVGRGHLERCWDYLALPLRAAGPASGAAV
jgi:hypothetical protein